MLFVVTKGRSDGKQSKHSLDGAIITIHRGLAIYKTHASDFWYARIRDPKTRRYVVRSTKETSRIGARRAAAELQRSLLGHVAETPREFSFRHYALAFLKQGNDHVASGNRNANYQRTARLFIENDDWGLLKHFGSMDVRSLTTRDFAAFMTSLAKRRPDLSTSTRNMLMATFRNVLKIARDVGVIDDVPATPRTKQKDNPRCFFRFHPLVPKKSDTYKRLLVTAKAMADEGVVVRGIPVTDEFYDLVLFVTHSFVRPTVTELYSIRHSDVQVVKDPKRLLVTIRRGKTGFRVSNTMPAAVSVLERIKRRYPDAKREDFLFLPQYGNRATAARVMQRQFNAALERANIKHDPVTDTDHTVYSLRHTAICMRIILSEGRVNIFNLAKNAGTSVEQIERFYAKHLPMSKEMAKNLHLFGGEG